MLLMYGFTIVCCFFGLGQSIPGSLENAVDSTSDPAASSSVYNILDDYFGSSMTTVYSSHDATATFLQQVDASDTVYGVIGETATAILAVAEGITYNFDFVGPTVYQAAQTGEVQDDYIYVGSTGIEEFVGPSTTYLVHDDGVTQVTTPISRTTDILGGHEFLELTEFPGHEASTTSHPNGATTTSAASGSTPTTKSAGSKTEARSMMLLAMSALTACFAMMVLVL